MSSVAEELERLAALRDRGVITEDEFARLKARLIESGLVSAPMADATLSVNRLRRSREDRWLGGVCGGIARLTAVESWVWRLVFALFFLFWGFGLLLYILLWIFVPDE
ncbi:PspC domain-containing protein [Aquabacterium sp.]|uniref:PspC domain-containing protein n=1 Tax=Aquabacterium sp. TaxID=1872578 RepID=UPI002E322F21|nr:PspC domain-containing protein [Aquabacterium sp.]HEX5310978.1 PspC domain-containing protein [Aquabacterium sp.]